MGHSRHYLSPATGGQVSENGGGDLSADIGKGVAIEEKKRSLPMTAPQKFYRFVEGEDGGTLFFPLCCCRFLSLSIKAVLRASSCARSSIEADDKLPTPVFEKLGSGL
jgi:hypothetical protein